MLLLCCLGCGMEVTPEAGVDEGPWESLEERSCDPDSFLTYENFGAPFMNSWCVGCHSSTLPEERRADAPVGLDYDDPNLFRPHLGRIWARAADQNETMPPAGGPPDAARSASMGPAERELLGEWLACGAPSDHDAIP